MALVDDFGIVKVQTATTEIVKSYNQDGSTVDYEHDQTNKALKPDGPTNQMQNAAAMDLQPGTPEYNEYMRRSSGGVTVNTGDAIPADPYAAKRAELAMDENQVIYQQGATARNAIASYDTALKLLDTVETGPISEGINTVKKYAGAFGADVNWDGIASYEQLSPIFGKMTMEKIQDTKGSVSNKEMEMYQKMNANYGYTTEGNRRLLVFARDRAKRDVAIRSLIRDQRKEGKSPTEISEMVDQYIESNDLSVGLAETEAAESPSEDQVYMNDSGEKIKWNGQTWIVVQ